MPDHKYVLAKADDGREGARLKHLEAHADALTQQHLSATGVGAGWRCLEVGAGGGSIARWLSEQVGPTGSVLATDLNPSRLDGLPDTVEVRRHDIARDDLETASYELVHCRFVLQHLADPRIALRKMASALAPGGWIVVEEGDFGLLELSGAHDSADANRALHKIQTRWATTGVVDSYLGRRVPGLLGELGLTNVGVDVSTASGPPGHPAYETYRMAWQRPIEVGPRAMGIAENDLECIERALRNSEFIIGLTTVAAWGRCGGDR